MPLCAGVRSVEYINDSGYPPRDRKARTMHATAPHTTAPQTTAPHPGTPLMTDQYAATPAPSQLPPMAPANADTTRGFAITSFVLGIASVVSGWTFFVPVAGLVFGIISLRRQTTERTLALWGVWLNAAMLALSAIVVIFLVAAAAIGFFAVGSIAMPTGF